MGKCNKVCVTLCSEWLSSSLAFINQTTENNSGYNNEDAVAQSMGYGQLAGSNTERVDVLWTNGLQRDVHSSACIHRTL